MAYNMPDATGSNGFMLTRVLEGEELQENGFGTRWLREQGYLRVRLDSIHTMLYGDTLDKSADTAI